MKKLLISILLVLICASQAFAFSGMLAGVMGASGGSGGGSGSYLLYWSATTTTIDYPNTITATATSPASLQAGGPNGNYISVGGAYHAGNYSIPITTALLNKGTSGRLKVDFNFSSGNGAKWLFVTNGDTYEFHGMITSDNKVEFKFGDGSPITSAAITAGAWHTAEFYWSGTTYGVIVDSGTPVTGTASGSTGSGTDLILGGYLSSYGVDTIDEVYLYAN